MIYYITRRFFTAIIVLLGVSIIAFLLPRLTGDPAVILMSEGATPEMIKDTREYWGLNKPLYEQYFTFLKNVLTGNMGESLISGRSTMSMVSDAFPNTLKLALCALSLAVIIGVPFGIISALKRNNITDLSIRFFSMLGRSIPHFWLGIMLILFFAVKLRILPSSGIGTGITAIKYLILPSFVLGLGSMSVIVRMVRSEMLEVLNKDYIITAIAKGLPRYKIILQHALKNAFIPIVTVIGLEIGGMMGGAIVTESVFAYPGLGRLAVLSIYGYDYPMIQTLVLIFSFIYIAINLIVDIIYAFLDPRVRYK